MTPARKKAYLLLLVNAVIWGAALPLVKPSLNFVSPFQFLYLRYLIASILIFPFLIILLVKHRPSLKTILYSVALELLATPISLGLLYSGLKQTSAIEASLIAATYPLLITVGGIYFLKEKQERREWLGLALALIGTGLLVVEPLLTNRIGKINFSFLGNLLVLAHNLLIAVYYLVAKKFYQGKPKFMVTGLGYLASAIVLFFMLNQAGLSTSVTLLKAPSVALASGYMALFGSIIALTFYIKGQDLIEASEASLFIYLTGVFAIPVSFLLLKESVTWPQILAMVIIFLGVFLGESRPRRLAKPKA
ncbi:MAG: hypothetical protein UX85_C0003G0073 [Candidatus Beckwithbacteria bacterium GW2011_GWB1_47_15]|uniref:EamA domain-containing protein n=1 Tax=Candidatus Beckwithbacteria bacterium GW2011_GWB1_47_15 TaxID=1618371 RepID=A0A0G1RVR1_9BACT|nr:MAG: hypothetical protein UY43_C0001G0390 [Candidatus Beckwithbacteria bacterium GW2011_GWC1_49_16]KKU35319.1 MAG: hypothetical protein UX50_C0004G0050 [Candidatus Beckwithbacteria bacterium GW2011_GWA1_46_30]KKU61414.1 MAG: hypothetical protein UX85_C0003G0073 [Candidatus Beckwithbacteria bacterium GW2011_GWB1_47_15]KKU71821.1 MAG: hypothetical protein UX97_C0003G0050 [Candidatus Beckwithbacteria bacterium GW2011_GWA2_47_25]KKW03715.1 MAG: hypothetical protein UY37_C0004G0008 [Candidatus Be